MPDTAEDTELTYSPVRAWLWRLLLSAWSVRVVGSEDKGATAIVEASPRRWHPAYWWFRLRTRNFIEVPVEGDA